MSIKTNSFGAREARKCRAKKVFLTVQSAGIQKAADWLNNKILQTIYECPYCDGFHLTSGEDKP